MTDQDFLHLKKLFYLNSGSIACLFSCQAASNNHIRHVFSLFFSTFDKSNSLFLSQNLPPVWLNWFHQRKETNYRQLFCFYVYSIRGSCRPKVTKPISFNCVSLWSICNASAGLAVQPQNSWFVFWLGLSVWRLHVLLVHAWVLYRYSNVLVRLIGDSRLTLGVSVGGCLSLLSLCCPVMDWQSVQGIPRLLPTASWDKLQHLFDLDLD